MRAIHTPPYDFKRLSHFAGSLKMGDILTRHRAGGDYYDFFQLPDDTWGILIADVSGHGTPAAVMMAITHSIAHAYPDLPDPPSKMLNYLNHHLASKYTASLSAFVTVFYGVYRPQNGP